MGLTHWALPAPKGSCRMAHSSSAGTWDGAKPQVYSHVLSKAGSLNRNAHCIRNCRP